MIERRLLGSIRYLRIRTTLTGFEPVQREVAFDEGFAKQEGVNAEFHGRELVRSPK
jgi:hypothetical protein